MDDNAQTPTPPAAPAEPTGAPPPETAAAPAPAPKPAKKESWWDTLRFFVYLFIGAVLLRTFVFAPFSIPSGSMLPNLMIGDYLFVAKWPYGYSRYSFPFGLIGFSGRIPAGMPDRGDVVVFRHPGPGNEDWVKRVIGLPGDTIEVRAGVVILNGHEIPRVQIADFDMPVSPNSPCRGAQRTVREATGADGTHHCLYPRFRETLPGGRSYEVLDQVPDGPGDNFGPVTVPDGHLFMMGDNRDDSEDSRFEAPRGVGLLPIDNVLGRALVGFWSTDGSSSWVLPWTWVTAARWRRIGETY